MITTRSRRLRTYLVLGGGALLLAVALGRPEPVALAAPMLLAATLGLALARTPRLELTTELDRQRALEGEEVELTLRVKAVGAVARLELRLTLPAGLGVASEPGENRSRLRAGETREYVWRVRCERWGGRLVGRVQVVARDPSGFFTYRLDELHLIPLRVYPRPDALRRLVRPADTQVWAGNEVSREKGEGIEFADIRPFLPGDRVRRVNWRVSARSGQLHVNEMRPERNTDLVVFLDTFTELRTAGESSVDMAVRAALALTRAYLRRRDRVGLVAFGGTLRWLRPDMGERQLYRILDALIDTEVVLSYAWKGLEVFPSRTLPPRSLVIALSPLLDDRSVGALLDLRGRGHDLAILEISPLPFVEPGRREPEKLAYRLWGMEREALRARFASRGVAIAAWRRGEPLQAPLAELSGLRTRAPVLGRPALNRVRAYLGEARLAQVGLAAHLRDRGGSGMHRIAVVVVMAVLLAACGGAASPSSTPEASQAPKSGGILQVALESELRTLDPAFSTQLVEREVFYNIYEALVGIDQHLKIIPGLARSWDIPDPKTYVFHLRQGVTFQDGTPFDATAVKWNLDRYRTAPGSFRKNDLASVDTVEVRDASTVVLHLKQPDATLLSTLVDRAGMMESPNAVQKQGKDFARNPVGAGTGPFEFVEWQNGDHLTVKKNPDYWQKGRPYLDQITFHPITNTDSSLAQLRSGGLDVVRVVSFKDVTSIKQDASLVYKAVPGLAFDGIEINRKGAFSDPDRAKAIALATDRAQIVKNVFFNVGTISNGPIPPPSWAFDPNEKIYVGADVAKAKKAATGFTFTLKTPNTPDSIQEAQLIKAQLAKAGITVLIQSEEFGQLLNEVEAHTFDAALVGWSGRIDPDGNMYAWFHTGGVNNDDQYSSAQVDGDLEQARLTTSLAQRKKLYDEAQKVLVGDVAYVFVHDGASQEVHTTHVHGFTLYPDQMLRFADTWKS